MKILLSVDSFKGTLSAAKVCSILSTVAASFGIQSISRPIADGGEGSIECLENFIEGRRVMVKDVFDPLWRKMDAYYYLSGKNAYVEVAAASGLPLVEESLRNPLRESDYGTGMLIADAVKKGAENIYLFCGGSATCSGGMGIAAALGYSFCDENGRELLPVGENMIGVKQIRYKGDIDFSKIKFTVLTDVKNPMFGQTGASYVFSPQKGASPQAVAELDQGLQNLCHAFYHFCGKDLSSMAGGGAAGGIAAGAVALFGAKVLSGIDWFMDLAGIDSLLNDADYLITGEGRLDQQTAGGKVMSGLLSAASKKNVPVLAIVGDYSGEKADYLKMGFCDIYRSKTPERRNFAEIKAHAEEDLEAIAKVVFAELGK